MFLMRKTYRLITVLLVALSLGFSLPARAAVAQEAQMIPALTGGRIFLPAISNPSGSIFGAYLFPANNASGLAQLDEANLNWTRVDVSWKTIEPTSGNIDWSKAASFDAMLRNAVNAGMTPVVILGDTPGWALKSGFACGAIDTAYFAEFARFAAQAVQRYSSGPYSVLHYEFYNEPDAPGTLGCWGDPSDTVYFGGYHYGMMLQSVYPAVKAANPQAQMLVGGLLLDCDPVNPPAGRDCTPAKFLEGALESGAGAAFDGVSYHAYDYYSAPGDYSNPNWHASRTANGPSFLAKAAFLKDLLARYGAAGKPLYNSEFALFHGTPGELATNSSVEATKSAYIIESMAGFLAIGDKSAIWHEVLGDRNNSLLNPDLSPRPAYNAYKAANAILSYASYARRVNDDPNFVIHEVNKMGKKIWIVWTVDNQAHTLTLPAVPQAVTVLDALGNPTAGTPGATITLDIAPAIIQFK